MGFENLLSAGAITQILDDKKPNNPVLQIIGYKPIGSDQMAFGQSTDELRYRLMIGDGIRAHQYCIITNQDLVNDIKSGKIEKWSVVRLTSYQTVDYGDGPVENKRRLIYILNLDIVKKGSEIAQKIVCEPNLANQTPALNTMSNANRTDPQPQIQPRPLETKYQAPTYPEPTQPQPYRIASEQNMYRGAIGSPRQVRGSFEQGIINISELTPYIGKWNVKARVTSKSAIRTYQNAKGEGKLFSFTMADKSGEVKVTAFNQDCDRVYPYVEPNKVYILGKAAVKNADKRYTTADYEITLNTDSLLEEIIDSRDADDIPLAKFNFVSIASLPNLPPNQPVDLIGAVTHVSEFSTIISKTKNKELKKRNITIVDMSRHTIGVTIWGEPAESFNGAVGDIYVTKAARIGTYAGRSASAGDTSFINPDIPEVRKIKNWYEKLIDQNFTALTQSSESGSSGDQYKSLDMLLDMNAVRNITSSGQSSAQYARCKAILLSVGRNPVYKCCPTDGCGKKLVDMQDGQMKCDKCQQTYSSYKYRYKTDVEIADRGTSSWVTLWDDKAENLLKCKPEELERYMKMDNKDLYEKIINKENFRQFNFTLRSRIDTYQQEERVKLNVVNMSKLDAVAYCKQLIDEIKSSPSAMAIKV